MKLILIHHLGSRKNGRPDQLAKYLAKRGNEVHLILWDVPYPMKLFFKNFLKSMKYEKYKRNGVIIHKISRFPFFFPLINKPLFKKQIRRIFKEYKIDLIISESYINEMDPPSDLPLVYSLVDDFEDYAKFYGSLFYKMAFKILKVKQTIKNQIKRSKATIVVSDLLVNYAKRYNKQVYKISNGVESWVLNKKFNKKKYDFGKHSLVYVSGFDHWSNLPNLLYSIDKIRKEIPDVKLVLVGDGVQIPLGMRIVKDLYLEKNVIFLGQVNNREELFEIINSCEVCLNLSEKNHRQDSASSVKVFEYSALGKPLISTRLKEVELLKFPNIIFYKDKKDNYDLIRAIRESFNKKVDLIKMKSMVRRYTWENIAKEFEEVLTK